MSEKHFIDGLVERYPRLFRGKHPRVMSDCPDGWQGLVERLFADVDAMLNNEQATGFRVEQIKEKFAGLRIYWRLGSQTTAVIDVVTEDSLMRLKQPPKAPNEIFDQVTARVDVAEEDAGRTCQQCGSAGTRRQIKGWLVTLCDQCLAQRENA